MANFLGILKQELNLMTCHLALTFNMAWRIRRANPSDWRYRRIPSIYGRHWRVTQSMEGAWRPVKS